MDKDRTLFKSQKNQIFKAIEETGLQPSDFRWETAAYSRYVSYKVSKIIHNESKGYFFFGYNTSSSGQHESCFWPSANKEIEVVCQNSWDERIKGPFPRWLSYLRLEMEPDLWAEMENEKKLAITAVQEDDNNTIFTVAEQTKISDNLREIKGYLKKTHKLEESKLKFIESKLSYLEEASERMGRKDWLNCLLGTITGIVVTLSFAPDKAWELFKVADSALAWLTHGRPLLP